MCTLNCIITRDYTLVIPEDSGNTEQETSNHGNQQR